MDVSIENFIKKVKLLAPFTRFLIVSFTDSANLAIFALPVPVNLIAYSFPPKLTQLALFTLSIPTLISYNVLFSNTPFTKSILSFNGNSKMVSALISDCSFNVNQDNSGVDLIKFLSFAFIFNPSFNCSNIYS